MTDDDGTIESGHPPDPGSGPGGAPEQSPATPPGPSAPPGPPAPRGQRASRHPHLPLPSFGVAHPAAPGPARAPAPSPASPPAHDPLSASLTGATEAGPAMPAPASSPGPAASPSPHPATTAPPDGTTPPLDIDQIASQVYERIGDKMDHRPDTAQDTPPAEQAIMLRDKAALRHAAGETLIERIGAPRGGIEGGFGRPPRVEAVAPIGSPALIIWR